MKRLERVLILNVHKKDKAIMNDFADLNTELLLKHFGEGCVFYFSDSIRDNGIKNTERVIRSIVAENGIDIVFFAPNGDNYELPIEFFRDLKDEFDCKCVLWLLDDEMIFDTYSKYYAQVFDAVITTDYYATYAYKKIGVDSLYFFSSYYKKDFFPLNTMKDIDVSFVGDCTKGNRLEYIDYLRKNGIEVKTFGDGTEAGFIEKEKLSEIFSRSKINLNFTRLNKCTASSWFLEENSLTRITRQNKGRPMEIALTNSFCLSEYSPSLGVTFVPGVDLDTFHDKETLLEKARFYLEKEVNRTYLATSAYQKAIGQYEADVFFPQLVERLRAKLLKNIKRQSEDEILKDTVFKKNHLIKLTIIMFYQLSHLKLLQACESFRALFQYGLIIFFSSFLKGVKITAEKSFSRFQGSYGKK